MIKIRPYYILKDNEGYHYVSSMKNDRIWVKYFLKKDNEFYEDEWKKEWFKNDELITDIFRKP